MNSKKRNSILRIILALTAIFILSLNLNFASSQGETAGVLEKTVCCEKTKSGLFCQDVPADECASERQPPTSCEATSFCKPGFCFDSSEGTCPDNTPQLVCNENNGTWSAEKPPQCDLGCCIMGDQASYVTLTRCRRLSSFYGIETDWNTGFESEPQCILSAGLKEKGACVFEEEFDKTCKMTTREECTPEGVAGTATQDSDSNLNNIEGLVPAPENSQAGSNTEPLLAPGEVKFYPGKLCSAEELGTNCGLSRQTTCLPGKEEVYFVDTCGNPANIYDASKINDKAYWADIRDKTESCSPGSGNENSQGCGNCNYVLGSYCRESTPETARPTYGTNICAPLNCVEENGKKRLHGESWCVSDERVGSVGSRHFRQVCINGEVKVEPCADFRQEECIENTREISGGVFSEAACRVNRWQDCVSQKDQQDCENSDKRECKWLPGIEYVLMGALFNGSSMEGNSFADIRKRAASETQGGLSNIPRGACVPEIPPGLKFYDGEEALGICSQANAICPVTYTKGVGGDWECSENCECIQESVIQKRAQLCTSIGDCGSKINWAGKLGYGKSFEFTQDKVKD